MIPGTYRCRPDADSARLISFLNRHEQCPAVPLKVPEVMPDAEQL